MSEQTIVGGPLILNLSEKDFDSLWVSGSRNFCAEHQGRFEISDEEGGLSPLDSDLTWMYFFENRVSQILGREWLRQTGFKAVELWDLVDNGGYVILSDRSLLPETQEKK